MSMAPSSEPRSAAAVAAAAAAAAAATVVPAAADAVPAVIQPPQASRPRAQRKDGKPPRGGPTHRGVPVAFQGGSLGPVPQAPATASLPLAEPLLLRGEALRQLVVARGLMTAS